MGSLGKVTLSINDLFLNGTFCIKYNHSRFPHVVDAQAIVAQLAISAALVCFF
jgi:hypothetical protein